MNATKKTGIVRRQQCCCCGRFAGRFAQHWNRDTGYGICRPCVQWEIRRGMSAEDVASCYGIEGENYANESQWTEIAKND